ncbi:MAG: hypothetical protein LBM26_00465 [Methanobrevibacter sp.]|jgi:hypothetical protein|nr:hypothetical protein [Methanobrevibacter sp.]
MNKSEKFVSTICKKSFLSFWSFPNPIRSDNNKELCDLLIVNDPYVIIISVKEIDIKNSGDVEVDSKRWDRKAIEKSYKQIYGAERAIKEPKIEIFTHDKKHKVKFPNSGDMVVYRVGISFGRKQNFDLPLGDAGKGFLHFFDQTSFPIIVNELDTLVDFVEYLDAKEKFYNSGKKALFNSEEDLLALYLHRGRTFENLENTMVEEYSWNKIISKTEFENRKEQEKESYFWDNIIEGLFKDYSQEALLFNNNFHDIELGLRVMSQETRFSRVMLSKALIEFIGFFNEPKAKSRLVQGLSGIVYVFLLGERENPEDINSKRSKELMLRCLVARNMIETKWVIGIATEKYNPAGYSFDLCGLYLPELSEDDKKFYTKMQNELGFFTNPNTKTVHYDEYPKQ